MDVEQNSLAHWNLPKRIIFRFLFSYLLLYILPFPLFYIPFSWYVIGPLQDLFTQLVDAVGPLLIGKNYMHSHAMTGSGDTSFDYATTFVLLLLSALVTLGWSLLDRKRLAYGKLADGLNILVRYYLAKLLLSYGFMKVFPTQFQTDPGRLGATYGESSPMGLLWRFMGSSPGYVIFTGAGEVLAGTLLLFRRTRLLGAMIAAFIMSHVFALNVFYDVPVKLTSLHLLLMALFLMASDAPRLVNLFLLNKPVDPEIPALTIQDRRLRWLGIALKIGLLYFLFLQTLVYHWEQKQENNSVVQEAASRTTSGEFEVLHFILNGDTLSGIGTETRRWRNVRLGSGVMEITYMDGLTIPWHCSIRNGSKKITIFSKDLTTSGDFSFERQDDLLSFQGILNQDSIRIVSKRVSENPFLLLSRKFQWISEEPFNR